MYLINRSSAVVSTFLKADILSWAFRCVSTQCRGGKTSAISLREAAVVHQSSVWELKVWFKCCGGTLRELWSTNAHKPYWTEVALERRVDQNIPTFINSFRKSLLEILVAKGGSTSCWMGCSWLLSLSLCHSGHLTGIPLLILSRPNPNQLVPTLAHQVALVLAPDPDQGIPSLS